MSPTPRSPIDGDPATDGDITVDKGPLTRHPAASLPNGDRI